MNKHIILDYEEYLEISGWAQKYLEIREYLDLPLKLFEKDLINEENAGIYLRQLLRKVKDK